MSPDFKYFQKTHWIATITDLLQLLQPRERGWFQKRKSAAVCVSVVFVISVLGRQRREDWVGGHLGATWIDLVSKPDKNSNSTMTPTI